LALPIVTLAARIEGGHLVLRGCRWPGAELLWSCTVPEADGFALERQVDERGRASHRAVLRTTDSRMLPLTVDGYRSVVWIYPRVLGRLNGWLASAKAGARW